jgi:hypothetical protein
MKFNRIHVVCEYLHFGKDADFACKRCPAWESSDYGKVQRGCYGLAKEACNIARVGNPWGKPPNSASAKRYRERMAKRIKKRERKPPTLRIVKGSTGDSDGPR